MPSAIAVPATRRVKVFMFFLHKQSLAERLRSHENRQSQRLAIVVELYTLHETYIIMRILIIEDHLSLAQALKHHFSDQGHAVTVVHDGEAGHQFLTQKGSICAFLILICPIFQDLRCCHLSALSALIRP